MKKTIIIIISIIVIILLIFLIQNVYKKINIGNTIISKSTEDIINNILNMKSYKAKITAKITSNKNENTYVLEQRNTQNGKYKQTVLEPSKIEGINIEYDGTNLKIENSKLNLSKIYECYPYITANELVLNSFIEDYKNNTSSKIEETENEIIMNTNLENTNKYIKYKTLTISKKTGKPLKLEIKDSAQNVLVYILYNDIEINSIDENKIFAKVE